MSGNQNQMRGNVNQGGQFAPRYGIQQFGPPINKGNQRQQDPRNEGQIGFGVPQSQTPETVGPQQPVIPIATGTEPLKPPEEPLGTEAFMVDVLTSNIGRFVLVTAQLGTVQREFEGVITDVGKDFTTIVNDRLGTLVILPTIFIQFVTVPVASTAEPTVEQVEPGLDQIEQVVPQSQG